MRQRSQLLVMSLSLATVAVAAACGSEREGTSRTLPASPGAGSPAAALPEQPRQQARPRREIQLRTFSLICPKESHLSGSLPPEGQAAWCQDVDGERYGPSAEWNDSGVLQRITMYSVDGSIEWVLSCELASDSGVVATWTNGAGEVLSNFQAGRCEDVTHFLPDR